MYFFYLPNYIQLSLRLECIIVSKNNFCIHIFSEFFNINRLKIFLS